MAVSLPLSRRAAVSEVLANFANSYYGEQDRRDDLKLAEAQQNRQLARKLQEMDYKAASDKELEAFKNSLPMNEKDRAYSDYLKGQGEASKVRADADLLTAKTRADELDFKKGEFVGGLQGKIAEAYDNINALKNENKLQKLKYELEKSSLKNEYSKKNLDDMQGDEYDKMIAYYEGLEERLLKIMVTSRDLEDEDSAKNTAAELSAVRERLQFLRQNHPYEQGLSGVMPPKMPEVKKPGVLSQLFGGTKKVGNEIKSGNVFPERIFQDGSFDEVTGGDASNKAGLERKVVDKDDIPKINLHSPRFYIKADRETARNELDKILLHLSRYPNDTLVMRRFKSLQKMDELGWYFN